MAKLLLLLVHFLPVHPLPFIVPSPVRPGGQRQTKPSTELIHVAFSEQSAIAEHSSPVYNTACC